MARFVKGQSGNPRGRPRTGASIAEHIRKLGGPVGEKYVAELHAMGLDRKLPAANRIAALQVLLERGFGKPPIDVNLGNQADKPLQIVHKQLAEDS